MSDVRLYLGDCLEIMQELEDGSVDAIITDIPYGTTACSWDEIIPFEPMWREVKRMLKPRGVFVTTASQPFTSKLVMSNPAMFKYEWIWEKEQGIGFANSNKMPLRSHENIVVFYKQLPTYNPQGLEISGKNKNRTEKDVGEYMGKNGVSNTRYIQKYKNYPKSVLKIHRNKSNALHPTQKPVALYKYLIKTYTNEGDTVLDFTMGSGTTGVACVQTGRNFIGIEIEPKYFEIAEKRIAEAQSQTRMPL
jgi:site-specific DNA-methyltransferase (adenine-specific)